MTTIVKIDRETGEVIPGEPQAGDYVRITNGATVSEHEYTPPQPPAAPAPRVFDSADWKGYAYLVLGTIAAPSGTTDEKLAAGMRRYGAILKAARASEDEGTIAALDQYDDATNFRKDKVSIFLSFLNADGEIVTDAELAGIVGGWPEV
jgi:hypothetical protein